MKIRMKKSVGDTPCHFDNWAEEGYITSLPPPQHKTLHHSALPATHQNEEEITLNKDTDNDWDLRQLEAYQDIVA